MERWFELGRWVGYGLLVVCLLTGCRRDRAARRITDDAAKWLRVERPDSALACLRSIDNPDL